jgi:isopentenyl phosphate kinase
MQKKGYDILLKQYPTEKIDWNYLMPIIEKIENKYKGILVHIVGSFSSIEGVLKANGYSYSRRESLTDDNNSKIQNVITNLSYFMYWLDYNNCL